ncbi:hypothetical protein TRAPUB_4783 [Trametes pubescens]|uniref:Uncharacterized protein n=1 Tax=Trametes pubescens TaxID=154538 RepID=A0A1M2VAH0_TRAPU|nr:hypothetical protein TRAPUB_4783 [Trametes pubescens]
MRRVHDTRQHIFPLLLLLSLSVASGRLVNRTIDDENGDSVTGAKPTYGPSSDPLSNWIQGTTCTNCHLLPNQVINVSETFDDTWHDSTYHPGNPDHTIDAAFTGTAVYVYFIVPNFVQATTTLVNVSFSIDGTFYGQYEHIPDSSTTISYQTLVFHTTNLVNTEHNIEIRASGSNASLILFDNMIYTFDEADPTSSPSLRSATATATATAAAPTASSTGSPGPSPSTSLTGTGAAHGSRSSGLSAGAIAGGVVGGVVAISIALALYCCLRRRRNHRDPRFLNWAKKPEVALPTSMNDAFDPDPPAATHTRPVTHPHVPSLPEDPRVHARWSTTASNSETLLDHSHRPISTPECKQSGREPEVELVASESTEVRSRRESLPSSSAYTGPSTSRMGESTLRAQVTLLREELERLRTERETQALFELPLEPPPRYEG